MPDKPFSNVLNMPQMVNLIGRQNVQEIPQVYDPEAINREALQAPRIDPVMTMANVATGGVPVGVDPGRMFGSILKDILFQHVMSAVGEHIRSVPAENVRSIPPKGYQEGYYPREKYSAPRSLVPFRVTEPLRGTSGKSADVLKYAPGDKRTELMESGGPPPPYENIPDYAKVGETSTGREFLRNLKPYEDVPPNPRELLWHAIGLDPDFFYSTVAKKIQEGGMQKGWFSEHPGEHFGPVRIGAKPEDLPPINPRARMLTVDPITELVPQWSNTFRRVNPNSGEFSKFEAEPRYTTIKGKPAPISVHPSKFTVIDSEGNLLGRLAEQRAGEKATTGLAKKAFQQILDELE